MPQIFTTKPRMGMWLGIFAAVLHAIAYITYGFDIWQGDVHTNPISWFLWVIGTFISYLIVRDISKDWAISLLNAVCAIGMTGVFILICYKITSSGLPITATFDAVTDIPIALLDIVVMGVWLKYRKSHLRLVNVVFQIDIFLSFLPIAFATLAHPTSETFAPWAIWTCAYLVQVLCVMYRASHANRESIHTPIHYLAWHFFMATVVLYGLSIAS